MDLNARRPLQSKVKQVHKSTEPMPLYRVAFNCNKEVTATEGQEFLTRSGFTPLRDLKVGDSVGFLRKQLIWTAAITSIESAGNGEVYSLDVEADEQSTNFIANGVIVR